MKNILFIILLVTACAFGQNKYITKTGTISFEASVPSFEEVAAKNNSVTAIINIENGEIAALALVKAFRFKNALMEEHFNENYAESDKYPKANFKGKILNFSLGSLNETSEFYIDGELEFHGVTKEIKQIPVRMKQTENGILLSGHFSALASYFNIEIPKIVKNKVSDEVQIDFNFELQKK